MFICVLPSNLVWLIGACSSCDIISVILVGNDFLGDLDGECYLLLSFFSSLYIFSASRYASARSNFFPLFSCRTTASLIFSRLLFTSVNFRISLLTWTCNFCRLLLLIGRVSPLWGRSGRCICIWLSILLGETAHWVGSWSSWEYSSLKNSCN